MKWRNVAETAFGLALTAVALVQAGVMRLRGWDVHVHLSWSERTILIMWTAPEADPTPFPEVAEEAEAWRGYRGG